VDNLQISVTILQTTESKKTDKYHILCQAQRG